MVIYDFGYETKKIKESMSRLNYENVHLRIDDRRKECYRADMQKIIICEEYDGYKEEFGVEGGMQGREIVGKKGIWN